MTSTLPPFNPTGRPVQATRNIAIIGNSIVAVGAFPQTSTATVQWLPNTAYSLNQLVKPCFYNSLKPFSGLLYKVTTAGTTSSSPTEPAWPQSVNGTVTDGGATFTAVYDTANGTCFAGTGWWGLAQALMGQPFDELCLLGYSGATSPTILAYMSAVLATKPDIVYFAGMFENDTVLTPAAATIDANFSAVLAAIDQCRALGIRVIWQDVLPSASIDASSAFTGYSAGAGTAAWMWLNRRIKEECRKRSDVIFLEVSNLYTDPVLPVSSTHAPCWPQNTSTFLSESGSGQQLNYTDGVHPNLAAAWLIANKIKSVVGPLYPEINRFGMATDAANLWPNPWNYGTGGGAVGGGGTITGNTNAPNGENLTCSGTVVTATIGQSVRSDIPALGNWLTVNYAAATAGGQVASSMTPNASAAGDFAVGSVVQFFSEQFINANPTNLEYSWNWMQFNGSSLYKQNYSALNSAVNQQIGQFITTNTRFVWKTWPLAVPSDVTTIALYSYNTFLSSAAGSGNIYFGRSVCCPIATPNL